MRMSGPTGSTARPQAQDDTGPVAVALAGGTAFLAGATDVYGLAKLDNLFVSFMSGNTTLLGKALGGGDLHRAAGIGGIVGLFVGGVAAGTVLADWSGRRHVAAVTGFVAILLGLAGVWPDGGIGLVVLAMGALNASMSRVGSTKVSLTYVTGTLVKVGEGFARLVSGEGAGIGWLLQAGMWVCLLLGATAAAAVHQAQPWTTPYTNWGLAAVAFILAVGAVVKEQTWP